MDLPAEGVDVALDAQVLDGLGAGAADAQAGDGVRGLDQIEPGQRLDVGCAGVAVDRAGCGVELLSRLLRLPLFSLLGSMDVVARSGRSTQKRPGANAPGQVFSESQAVRPPCLLSGGDGHPARLQ